MNNTKSLTAIAAIILMAATLVVGTAGTVTTQLASAAYGLKKGGVAAQDNSNSKNGNTVTIEKCKQAATESGFDNTEEQECQNLICTHPGENATCSQEGAAATPTPVKLTCEQCFTSLLTQAQISSLLRILNVASLEVLCADLQNHIIAGLELEDALSQVTPSVSDETLVALQDCLRDVGIVFGTVRG
jgi:hypothetical protein